MKKILGITTLIVLLISLLPFSHKSIKAQSNPAFRTLTCGININSENVKIDLRYPEFIFDTDRSFNIDITGGDFGSSGIDYYIYSSTNNVTINDPDALDGDMFIYPDYPLGSERVPTFIDGNNNAQLGDQLYIINFSVSDQKTGDFINIDGYIDYNGDPGLMTCPTMAINVVQSSQIGERCNGNSNASIGTFNGSSKTIVINVCLVEGESAVVREFRDRTSQGVGQIGADQQILPADLNENGEYSFEYNVRADGSNTYLAVFSINISSGVETLRADKELFLDLSTNDGNQVEPDRPEGCALEDDGQPNVSCQKCIDAGGIWIAIGCVDPTPLGIMTRLVQTGIGVMGGVALVQLIIVGLYLQSGQEAKIAEGKKKLIATLTGIVVLVFSVLILRIIGVNVLDAVPGGFL